MEHEHNVPAKPEPGSEHVMRKVVYEEGASHRITGPQCLHHLDNASEPIAPAYTEVRGW